MFDSDNVECLRLRLLIPVFPIVRGYHLRCPCSPVHIQDSLTGWYHCVSCSYAGGYQTTNIGCRNQIQTRSKSLSISIGPDQAEANGALDSKRLGEKKR
jgi:hypothetical protein